MIKFIGYFLLLTLLISISSVVEAESLDCGYSLESENMAGPNDLAIICMGEAISDKQDAKVVIRTKNMGNIGFEVLAVDEDNLKVKLTYGDKEQIHSDDQKQHANSSIECSVDLDEVISSNSDKNIEDYPGELALSVYFYVGFANLEPDEFNCVVKDVIETPDLPVEGINEPVRIINEISVKENDFSNRLKGRILLKVESEGESWYIHTTKQKAYYLGRPSDAFQVMREQGIGITNNDLNKISIGLEGLNGLDSDNDGLPDDFEEAIGTDKNKQDSDDDVYGDKQELENGYSPTKDKGVKLNFDDSFSERQKGKIFLQIESKGEAWYVNPEDGKRYFLGRPADAFQVMRNLGLGISNYDFNKL